MSERSRGVRNFHTLTMFRLPQVHLHDIFDVSNRFPFIGFTSVFHYYWYYISLFSKITNFCDVHTSEMISGYSFYRTWRRGRLNMDNGVGTLHRVTLGMRRTKATAQAGNFSQSWVFRRIRFSGIECCGYTATCWAHAVQIMTASWPNHMKSGIEWEIRFNGLCCSVTAFNELKVRRVDCSCKNVKVVLINSCFPIGRKLRSQFASFHVRGFQLDSKPEFAGCSMIYGCNIDK